MKKFVAVLSVALFAFTFAVACDEAKAGPKSAPTLKDGSTQEELTFLAEGPRLYPMDKALELSKQTGKPVVCWMGKHIFADAKARELSRELGETTIQAAMDSDGTIHDRANPRLKFSSSNYQDEAQTYFIRVSNIKEGTAEKVLAVARGAAPRK